MSLVVGCAPHSDRPVEQDPQVEARASSVEPKAPVDAKARELPYALTSRQVRDVLEPLEPELDNCAEHLSQFRNIDVRVKLTIEGSTGKVTNAESLESDRGEEVGRCVAAKVRDARFPRFQKSSQGVSYPFTLLSRR